VSPPSVAWNGASASEPGRDVDAIAEDVVALDQDVAEMTGCARAQ
jgi:hypothetical protein